MTRDLIFNENADIRLTDEFGYIDLVEAFSNGSIPAEVSDTDVNYNEIEDPSTIMGKPSDVFEAMRFNQYVHENGTVREDTE